MIFGRLQLMGLFASACASKRTGVKQAAWERSQTSNATSLEGLDELALREGKAAVARHYESQGLLPEFTSFGEDVAQPGALARAAAQISFRREVILICGDGSAFASPMALNTVLQFWAMRLRHVLYVSDSPESCARLRNGAPGLACVWSSSINKTKPVNGGLCNQKYWDMRFYFYVIRKEIVARLAVELGINVLQTDTDVAWFANPYPLLKLGLVGRTNLVSQWDAPFVNAGCFYVQNVQPGDGAAWVLTELHRRIRLFMFTPEAVKKHVPWAAPPYFANSDEQTLMNDVIISAILGEPIYVFSTAFFEGKFGGGKRVLAKRGGWERTAEAAVQRQVRAKVGAKFKHGAYPLRAPGGAGGVATFYNKHGIFSHYSPAYFRGSPRQQAELAPPKDSSRQAIAAAAAEGRPSSYTTLRRMPATMYHLAGIRTGAWSRRAILRAHGWWHSSADTIVSEALGWNKRLGYIRVGAAVGAVQPETREQYDTLAANLVLLGVLSNRIPIIPEAQCGFMPHSRSCFDGCNFDSMECGPRRSADGTQSQRCAWLPPKRCWRVEYSMPRERERRPANRTAPHARGSAETARLAGRAECRAVADALVRATVGRWRKGELAALVRPRAPTELPVSGIGGKHAARSATWTLPTAAGGAAFRATMGAGAGANSTRRALIQMMRAVACGSAKRVLDLVPPERDESRRATGKAAALASAPAAAPAPSAETLGGVAAVRALMLTRLVPDAIAPANVSRAKQLFAQERAIMRHLSSLRRAYLDAGAREVPWAAKVAALNYEDAPWERPPPKPPRRSKSAPQTTAAKAIVESALPGDIECIATLFTPVPEAPFKPTPNSTGKRPQPAPRSSRLGGGAKGKTRGR